MEETRLSAANVVSKLIKKFDHGCVRFSDFLQNFRECQILRKMCSVVFLAFTFDVFHD